MYASAPYIEESRFGNWFLRTDTWRLRVLCRALDDLQRLIPAGARRYPRVLDVGCGYGHSFAELARRFSPALNRHAGAAAARGNPGQRGCSEAQCRGCGLI